MALTSHEPTLITPPGGAGGGWSASTLLVEPTTPHEGHCSSDGQGVDVSDGIHHPTLPCPTPQLIGLGSLLKRGKKYKEEDKKTGAA